MNLAQQLAPSKCPVNVNFYYYYFILVVSMSVCQKPENYHGSGCRGRPPIIPSFKQKSYQILLILSSQLSSQDV